MEVNLSKIISEAKEETTEAIKNSFSQRLGGHFTAYLATSWLAYNWSNIAFLFMSKVSIEQRLEAIYGQDSLYFNYLIAPFITACVLSIFFPAMNALVANLTSFFSASSQSAEKRAMLLIDTWILKQQKKKTETAAQIEKITDQKEKLNNEVSVLSARHKQLSEIIEASNVKIIGIALRALLLTNQLEAQILRSNNGKITIPSDELYKLFSDTERKEASEWFNNIKNIKGLDEAMKLTQATEPEKFLDPKYIQEIIDQSILKEIERQSTHPLKDQDTK